MAWIETVDSQSVVNLDRVVEIRWAQVGSRIRIEATTPRGVVVLRYTDANVLAVQRAMLNIAGLARGNVLISQDDIEKMLTD